MFFTCVLGVFLLMECVPHSIICNVNMKHQLWLQE